MTNEEARGYIAAIVDGEGGIYSRRRYISICYNTDLAVLGAVQELLTQLEIPFSVNVHSSNIKRGFKPLFRIDLIGGEVGIRKFASTIPIQSEHKKEALREILRSYGETNVVRL